MEGATWATGLDSAADSSGGKCCEVENGTAHFSGRPFFRFQVLMANHHWDPFGWN